MPNGNEFFTAGQDSIVRWHDANSGNILRSLDTQQREINSVAYNLTGTSFTTAGDDGTVKLWNAKDLSLIRSIKANKGNCYVAHFINDELIFTGGEITPCAFFSAATGELVRQLSRPDANPAGVISPGLTDVYVSRSLTRAWTCYGSKDDRYPGIYMWDMANGRSRRFCEDLTITNICADKSEKLLFVTSLTGIVRVLNAGDCTERCSMNLPTALYALSLSEDERYLVAGGNNGHIYLWRLDLKDANVITSPIPLDLSVHKGRIHEAIFTPDGNALMTTGQDGTVRRTASPAMEPFRDVSSQCKYSYDIITTGAGPVAFFENEPISFHDTQVGDRISPNAFQHLPSTNSVSDSTLALITKNHELGILKVATGELLIKIPFKDVEKDFDFSSDGSLLAIVSERNDVVQTNLLDVRTGTPRPFSPAVGTSPLWVRCCADNGLIAFLPATAKLVCWNIHDETVRWQTTPNEIRCALASLSPNREFLVTADGKDISLIDCKTGNIRCRAQSEHSGSALAILPGGRSFIFGGAQGQVGIWRLATLQPLFEIGNIGRPIWSIRPLPNGFLAGSGRSVNGHKERFWFEF
jgi:WD40 repeat protein